MIGQTLPFKEGLCVCCVLATQVVYRSALDSVSGGRGLRVP